jgi:hypothetical protein
VLQKAEILWLCVLKRFKLRRVGESACQELQEDRALRIPVAMIGLDPLGPEWRLWGPDWATPGALLGIPGT